MADEGTNTAIIGGVITGAFAGIIIGGLVGSVWEYIVAGQKLAKTAEL